MQQCQNGHLALSCLCSGLLLSQPLPEAGCGKGAGSTDCSRQWALPSIHHQWGKAAGSSGAGGLGNISISVRSTTGEQPSWALAVPSHLCGLSFSLPSNKSLTSIGTVLLQLGMARQRAEGVALGTAVDEVSWSGGVGRSAVVHAGQKACWSNSHAGRSEEAPCWQPHRNHSGLTSRVNNCLSQIVISLPWLEPRTHWSIMKKRVCTGWFVLGLRHLLICTVIPAYSQSLNMWGEQLTSEGSTPGNPVDLVQESGASEALLPVRLKRCAWEGVQARHISISWVLQCLLLLWFGEQLDALLSMPLRCVSSFDACYLQSHSRHTSDFPEGLEEKLT